MFAPEITEQRSPLSSSGPQTSLGPPQCQVNTGSECGWLLPNAAQNRNFGKVRKKTPRPRQSRGMHKQHLRTPYLP
ncbi:hypothetical protein NPIL_521001 [Nephila pilipes]|uniref:Uncharacterized protein n=1 Tax=Nephila pilipes TaxID=299642 RepID=A0A8X6TGU7_NEPPI|nr:hypothetical protein NPIL_521001 [Nephila pilipes]